MESIDCDRITDPKDFKIKTKDERYRYPRFFTEVSGSHILITGDDAKHIFSVLRMKPGDLAVICDNKETDYLCRIASANKDLIEFEALDKRKNDAEPSVSFVLYQCLPKGDKMDFIVQKAVELGACEIVPTLSKRCVSRPDDKSVLKKISRWKKISEEAAKQCGRGHIPEMGGLIDFKSAVKAVVSSENDKIQGFEKNILFYEGGGKRMNDIIGENTKKINVFIGSEGGFDEDEISFAKSQGITLASLGPRILRCETAPLAALSVLMNLTGNI